jgi:hypothetical protein
MPTREKSLAEIVPALLIPPAKVVTSLTSMPLAPAAILPLAALRMPPEKIEVLLTKMPSWECPAEIVPLLVMPPAKVSYSSLQWRWSQRRSCRDCRPECRRKPRRR